MHKASWVSTGRREKTIVSKGTLLREGGDDQLQEVASRILAGTLFTLFLHPADGEVSQSALRANRKPFTTMEVL